MKVWDEEDRDDTLCLLPSSPSSPQGLLCPPAALESLLRGRQTLTKLATVGIWSFKEFPRPSFPLDALRVICYTAEMPFQI